MSVIKLNQDSGKERTIYAAVNSFHKLVAQLNPLKSAVSLCKIKHDIGQCFGALDRHGVVHAGAHSARGFMSGQGGKSSVTALTGSTEEEQFH